VWEGVRGKGGATPSPESSCCPPGCPVQLRDAEPPLHRYHLNRTSQSAPDTFGKHRWSPSEAAAPGSIQEKAPPCICPPPSSAVSAAPIAAFSPGSRVGAPRRAYPGRPPEEAPGSGGHSIAGAPGWECMGRAPVACARSVGLSIPPQLPPTAYPPRAGACGLLPHDPPCSAKPIPPCT